jgi:hypothetical protein
MEDGVGGVEDVPLGDGVFGVVGLDDACFLAYSERRRKGIIFH